MSQSEVLEKFSEQHFLQIGEARVCYREAGEGPVLVLLHGYPLSGHTWRKIIPALSLKFRCIAFDLVGLGQTTSSAEDDYASPGQGRVFQRALAELGIDSYALLANDSGGWVAREVAFLDQERVTHLILTNTEIPNHRPPWVWFYQFLAWVTGGSHIFQLMLSSRLWRRSSMGFGGCFQNHDLIEGEFFDAFLKPLLTSRARIRRALKFLVSMDFDRVDEFVKLHPTLSMPVALIWGEEDPTFPIDLAREMSTQFRSPQFIAVPEARLFLHEEFPAIVLKPILEVLTGVGSAPALKDESG